MSLPTLTPERLRELLSYDPETGVFRWRVTNSVRAMAGAEAGYKLKVARSETLYYRQIRIDKKLYQAHRLAWLYVTGLWPSEFLDHIDGDGLNNRMANLREASSGENQRNMRMHKDNETGLKGVTRAKNAKGYYSNIMVAGKKHYLGYFKTPEAAHAAYCEAAQRLHGRFARTS